MGCVPVLLTLIENPGIFQSQDTTNIEVILFNVSRSPYMTSIATAVPIIAYHALPILKYTWVRPDFLSQSLSRFVCLWMTIHTAALYIYAELSTSRQWNPTIGSLSRVSSSLFTFRNKAAAKSPHTHTELKLLIMAAIDPTRGFLKDVKRIVIKVTLNFIDFSYRLD